MSTPKYPDTEIRNARIETATIEREDHGIMTCSLGLDYSGSGQHFGGYAFDEPIKENGEFKGRRGTAYGMEFIIRILDTVGVDRWDQLVGKHIRVEQSHTKVYRIGHITEDRWFDPADLAKEFYPEELDN